MVNVWYKKVMGVMTLVEHRSDGDAKFKMTICKSNALAAFIYTYKNKNGEKMKQLYSFFADEKHVKNLLREYKDEQVFGDLRNIQLNMFYPECKTLLNFFTQQGYKVTCFYKQPKGK